MSVGRLAKVMRAAKRASKGVSGPAKYHSIRTVCRQDHRHDSKKESLRCDQLHILMAGGAIDQLEIHPKYALEVNGQHICNYIGDFLYRDTGIWITEDVKGRRTPVYAIKRKLMRAILGIDILET